VGELRTRAKVESQEAAGMSQESKGEPTGQAQVGSAKGGGGVGGGKWCALTSKRFHHKKKKKLVRTMTKKITK